MAGTVEHLAIAWELSQRLDIENIGLFIAGNVCPDGIMARENYQRPMKMHTHFRDGIPDYEFSKPEHLELFHQRIREFAEKYYKSAGTEKDLYLGYLTHILADEIFMLTIRPEFMEKMKGKGLTDRDMKTFEYFTYDVNQIDYRLAKEYSGMNQVLQILKSVEPYEIRDMITKEELTRSREWILNFFFNHAPEWKAPIYYTYSRALDFICEAVEIIEYRVKEYI